jgi:hypothetical protein
LNDTDINSKYLEQLNSYKCLGSIVNGDNFIEEEIKERNVLGNKAYHASQKYVKANYYQRKLNYCYIGP